MGRVMFTGSAPFGSLNCLDLGGDLDGSSEPIWEDGELARVGCIVQSSSYRFDADRPGVLHIHLLGNVIGRGK